MARYYVPDSKTTLDLPEGQLIGHIRWEWAEEPEPPGPPPVFKQCDWPWRDEPYSPSSSLTFCRAGCLVCSLASLACWVGYDVNPITFAESIAEKGAFDEAYLRHPTAVTLAYPRLLWRVAGEEAYWSPRRECYETSFIDWRNRPVDLALLRMLLAQQPVVVEVDYDPFDPDVDQHFVLAVEYVPDPEGGLNDDLLIMDPMAGMTSVLSYFNPAWLNDWMRRNEVTKVMRTVTGARVWEVAREEEEALPYIDIVDEMPVNQNPTAPDAWWVRTPEQITGITVHHTMSHDARATARYCTDVKGRPSIQYHFWVAREGEVYLCAPLEWGMWHDHCGHENPNVSVGLAGRLHEAKPSEVQLQAAARIVAWLMEKYNVPLPEVQGHNDRYAGTICPGWDHADWREDFYTALDEELG